MNASLKRDAETAPNAYERAFVRTLLRLQGVIGRPTELQYARAMQLLRVYELRVAEARDRDLAEDTNWLRDRQSSRAAVERAFVFVRFDSVLQATPLQSQALHRWLRTGACLA